MSTQRQFIPARARDLPFIRETVARLRLDGEDLRAEQFLAVRRNGRVVAFGRIKPYRDTAELGCVAVLEEQRGRGLGGRMVRELIRRFPQDEVYITTDLPEYFERLGFQRRGMSRAHRHAPRHRRPRGEPPAHSRVLRTPRARAARDTDRGPDPD